MAIPEACGLWIEQRVQEELEARGDTGASLRDIGRQVAAEVERYFETRVNPRTIEKRAERQNRKQGATNVAPAQPTETTAETPKSNEIKRQPAQRRRRNESPFHQHSNTGGRSDGKENDRYR